MGKLSHENAVKEASQIFESLGAKFDVSVHSNFVDLVAAGRIRSDGDSIFFTLARPINFGGVDIREVKVSDPIRSAMVSANLRLRDLDNPEMQDRMLSVYCCQPVEFIGRMTNSDAMKIAGTIIPVFF